MPLGAVSAQLWCGFWEASLGGKQTIITAPGLNLYKISFHSKALLWESIILLILLLPHLQSLPYCNTIARPLRNIPPPHRPPLVMSYTIQYW